MAPWVGNTKELSVDGVVPRRMPRKIQTERTSADLIDKQRKQEILYDCHLMKTHSTHQSTQNVEMSDKYFTLYIVVNENFVIFA